MGTTRKTKSVWNILYVVIGGALLIAVCINGVGSYHPIDIIVFALKIFISLCLIYVGLFVSTKRITSRNSLIDLIFAKDKDDDNASTSK
jgi:uncharacterized protein YacL